MSAVDWEAKPEPWRSIGLEFLLVLQGMGERPPSSPSKRLGQMSSLTTGETPAGRIKNLRLRMGWSANRLSEKAGLSWGTVKDLERGHRFANANTRAAIAAALDVSVGDIWP